MTRSRGIPYPYCTFPLAAQAARVQREVDRRAAETVALITSRAPAVLLPARWLELNRQHSGIENWLHARRDVSRRDDECRLRSRNAVWVHGIFARLANSRFIEWRSHQPMLAHKSTSDFSALMAADHARCVLLTVTTRKPNLRSPS